MRTIYFFSKVISLLLLFCIVACSSKKKHEEDDAKIPLKDRMDLAIQHEITMTKDPALGYVPKERLLAAKAYKDRIADTRAALSGEWKELGPSNVAGRSRCVLVDANDATGKTVWVGSVGGGLWKTTDITAEEPNWIPIDDFLGNLAVTCIAQDPSNPNIMYLGTGEGYGNGDAIRGFGVWKTTNGGTTWSQLSATTGVSFNYCQKIVVNSSGVLFVATGIGGLLRSTNGGTSFAKVLGAGIGITGVTINFCYDVDIAANGDVFATLYGSIHKSTDGGATFGSAITTPIAGTRIEIACAPNDANYAYALVENSNVVNGILRTTDGGATWISRTEPADADPGIPPTDFSRGQAWYDLAITVDPNNRDVLMVGGIDLFKSSDGAGTWTQLSHWYGGFNEQYVHADQHYIIYKNGSSSEAYFVNDGGIYRTTNANVASPTITFKGDNYNVTQFYSCAMHPTAAMSYFLAGAQDNGSHQFTKRKVQQTVEVTGGDGAFCHIDQDQPQFQFTSYVYNDFYRSADGGVTWTNFSTPGGSFISPTDYDNVNNRMYMCDGTNNYKRWENPQTGGTFTSVSVPGFGGSVSAVTVSPNTNHRVFFGISNGRVFRVDNAHTATPTATSISTGLPSGYPACIEVETGNDNHLLVTYSSYGLNSIWESTNGGTSWTSVEGNLPDMPIRWALFNPDNSDQVILATELGVWSTDNLNGGSTVWGATNSGLANVRVDMLQIRASDKYVIAATHGRGLFGSDIFTAPTAFTDIDIKVGYKNTAIQFYDVSYKSATRVWNFGDGTTSTAKNPAHTYTTSGVYDVSLTINSGASSITKTAYVTILPDKGTPYNIADGGNFETNENDFSVNHISGTSWVRGNSTTVGKSGSVSPSNVWLTGLSGTYADNSRSELWTPCYNFMAPGTYTLGFSAKFVTETGFDGFRVEYSLNRGSTWAALGTTVSSGWYNNANNSGAGIFPANEAMFSGSLGSNFVNYTRNVSFLSGNNSVSFRIVFASDVAVNAAGIAIDNFSVTGTTNPVFPLNLLSFTGEKENDKVNLSWQTENEVNFSHFEVERATEGNSFVKIGEVNGGGGATNDYHFYDLVKNIYEDKAHYRLKMVDIDNQYKYSNIIEILFEREKRKIAISPNPFQKTIQIDTYEQIKKVEIWDVAGNKVYHTTQLNDNELYLDKDLAKGIYVIQVTTDRQIYRQKALHIE